MFHKNAQVAGKIYEKHPSKMPRLQAPPQPRAKHPSTWEQPLKVAASQHAMSLSFLHSAMPKSEGYHIISFLLPRQNPP